MKKPSDIPDTFYGVLEQERSDSELEEAAEQIRRLGYAVLDAGYTAAQLQEISEAFERARHRYIDHWGAARLQALNELHTVRALLTQGESIFMRLALNSKVLSLAKILIRGKFILNQQNGIINPPGETYNQAAWHRDLPYQHYVATTPLALNALFCVDDFTLENGSTFVLPGSHKEGAFPSPAYLRQHALQLEAKAGQYIVLDCMLFHSGGFNNTGKERRAVNHVYNIPYFKQQINLPNNISLENISSAESEILGVPYLEPSSVQEYLNSRAEKMGVGTEDKKNG